MYDNASHLKQITTQSSSVVRAKFEYDALGRLKARKNAADAPQEEYAYDGTGNRTSAGELYTVPDPNAPPGGGGGTIDQFITTTYTYATDSHRLMAVGGEPRAYSGNGNLIMIGDPNGPGGTFGMREYEYNNANRMSVVKANGGIAATYLYNGFGEHVQRQTTVTTRFVYDEAGQLLGQYDAAGNAVQQCLWLDGQPVGMLTQPMEGQSPSARLKYVQSDVLGSPRAIIDPARNLAVWRWDEMKEGFGDHAPQTDPDSDGTHVVFDLRFPGQRFDAASGLHYNYFRDYDPATGRYIQSDPIGLAGGVNTYGYVGSSPTIHADRFGLERELARPLPFPDNIVVGQVVHMRFAGYVRGLGSGFGANDSYGGVFGNLRPDAYRHEGLGLPKRVWELKPISNMDRSDLYHDVALARINQYLAQANRKGRGAVQNCGDWKAGHGTDLFDDGQDFGQVTVYFLASERTYDIRLYHDIHPGNTGLVFYEATLAGERNRVMETLREAAEEMARQPPWWYTMPPISGPQRPGYP